MNKTRLSNWRTLRSSEASSLPSFEVVTNLWATEGKMFLKATKTSKSKPRLWPSTWWKGCTRHVSVTSRRSKIRSKLYSGSTWLMKFPNSYGRNTFKNSSSRCKAAASWRCGSLKIQMAHTLQFRLLSAFWEFLTTFQSLKSTWNPVRLQEQSLNMLQGVTSSRQVRGCPLSSCPPPPSSFRSGRLLSTNSLTSMIRMACTRSSRETWDADSKSSERWTKVDRFLTERMIWSEKLQMASFSRSRTSIGLRNLNPTSMLSHTGSILPSRFSKMYSNTKRLREIGWPRTEKNSITFFKKN